MLAMQEALSFSTTHKLTQIFESNLESIKKASTTSPTPNWQYYTSETYLMSIIDDEVPKNRNSNLSRCKVETPAKLIKEIVQNIYPDNYIWCSGSFYYPPTGYMSWHTNHDDPAERLYITYASEENKSFFRYYKDGKVITDYDKKGITVRKFQCPGTRPYFWHCVGSECDRISIGFTLKHCIQLKLNPQARYAVIKDEQVVNVIKWNGDTSIWKPPSDTIAVFAGADGIDIGTKYINGSFIIPSVS